MSKLGLVIIGRNEGQRLERCLRSTSADELCRIYVDSGSTDGSIESAHAAGAHVVNLDLSLPFSAARARNEGFRQLVRLQQDIEHVQFVDADCELVAGWMERAADELKACPELAAVCGRLRERYPKASIYNRLCDLEWSGPSGEIEACGGVAMYRVAAFMQVGGFDPTVTAGEEPVLCQRLRDKGWKIVRLNEEMALHDAAMLHFRQWWTRQIRGGYGGSDVVHRFDSRRESSFARQIRSARVWGLAWPAAVLVAGFSGWCLCSPSMAVVMAGVVVAALPVQMARLALRTVRRGIGLKVAMAYGVLTMVGKWANLVGQWRCLRDRQAGRLAQLIEYKSPQTFPTAAVESGPA